MMVVTDREVRPEELAETPSIEVRAYRGGELFDRRLFESEAEAKDFVESLRDEVDVEVELVDLSSAPEPRDAFDAALGEDPDEERPEAVELE